MKVYEVQQAFGLSNLRLAERPSPQPGPWDVRVRIHANSLNYRDLLMVLGHYNPRQPLPLIPLSDGAGEVLEVGEKVTRFKPGDRVAAIFAQDWLDGDVTPDIAKTTLGGPLDGMLAEEVCLPENGWVMIPDHLDYIQAATLPCAALTAWSSLVVHGNVKAGDTVLVLGTGGVSIFAVQFAKLLGAKVIATSSSDEKLTRVKALGADETINYKTQSAWGKEVLRLTDGLGVDHVVEVGGSGTLAQSLKAVRPSGTVSLIGVLGGSEKALNILPILMKNIRVQGILVGHRAGFESMNRAIAHHGLVPVVDQSFSFGEAPKAFDVLQQAGHFGKICLRSE